MLQMAHTQMSKKLRSLSTHVGIHKALLVGQNQRTGFLSRISISVHVVERQDFLPDIQLTYIMFDLQEASNQVLRVS